MQNNKLVILSAFYEPYMSGAEQMVKEVLERLGDRYETTLVTGRFSRTLAKAEKRNSFYLKRVGVGHKQIDKLLYPLLAAWEVKKIKPAVTHAIMESYAGGALVLVKYLLKDTKRILTLQSGDLDDPKKQKNIFIQLFWKIIHRSPDIVTAISTFLAKRAESLGVSRDKIFITPNGVDFSEITESTEKITNRVVCVARLSWEKGLDFLIKAWLEVIKKVPDAELVMVGDGDKRLEIESLIKELNIADSVVLMGNLPHRQTLIEIKKSEIFVCPSLAEGLGNVFIEAQACGVTPIGTRVGGIPDIIQDGMNGVLVEPKNTEAISQSIINLLSNKELNKRLAARGLETVRRFDWQKIIEEIDVIYKTK